MDFRVTSFNLDGLAVALRLSVGNDTYLYCETGG